MSYILVLFVSHTEVALRHCRRAHCSPSADICGTISLAWVIPVKDLLHVCMSLFCAHSTRTRRACSMSFRTMYLSYIKKKALELFPLVKSVFFLQHCFPPEVALWHKFMCLKSTWHHVVGWLWLIDLLTLKSLGDHFSTTHNKFYVNSIVFIHRQITTVASLSYIL